ASPVLAQRTARGLGMAGAYTAIARGIHAPVYNPANLGLPDNSKFSFTFVSATAGGWNNSFNNNHFNQYNGQHLTSGDIEDILSNIPESGFGLGIDTYVQALSFSVGRFALTLAGIAVSRITLDKALFDIAFNGIYTDESYNLDENEAEAVGYGAIQVSYAHPFKISGNNTLSVGANLSYYYAGGYARADQASFLLDMRKYDFDLDGRYEASYAYPDSGAGGTGVGLDLGVASTFGDRATLSFSLMNVLGSLPWSDEMKREIGYVRGEGLTVLGIEDAVTDSSWSVTGGESMSSRLPLIIRLGGSYDVAGFLLAADYVQSFSDSPWSSTKPQLSLGAEFMSIPVLGLRAGFMVGGRMGFASSFGISLRPGWFVLDIGVMNRGFISPNSSKGFIFGFELGLNFKPKKPE
ncbi:hypothetical protein BVY01_02780, partial [bacterium I07]